jgi:hypothetical protein
MRYFDPNRPTLGTLIPMYVDSSGDRVAAIPQVSLDPNPDGTWIAGIPLRVGPSAYRIHNVTLTMPEVQELLLAWVEDPESVMRTTFGWEEPTTGKRSGSAVSLDDLEL